LGTGQGKVAEIKNQKQQRCGNYHVDAPMWDAYVQCWPFDAKMCSHCGDVSAGWGWFKQGLFDVLVGWWWQGAVLVKNDGKDPAIRT